MRGGDHHPDPRQPLWHGGVTQRHGEDTLIVEHSAEFPGQLGVSEHHGCDGGHALAGIETQGLHLTFEHIRIGPQPVHQFG